ncbi:MAG: bifunctional UDP-N-acetylglucosamine diphosphorylase/glucosamine-1-phosphate N-acetyltransferase GlmU [Hyphomicrobiales bacterium]|nr:bifunctional UDP-N-acetylglucosamine diphosphorylase/glucosamine-1-phosphate N-acetyltransferase GlmU [Hyphomicrobiales bacterium]
MTDRPLLAIVLAAGKGTRMKSDRPKVLHALAGAPMVAHVLQTACEAGVNRTALVVAPGMDAVEAAARAIDPDVTGFVQQRQRGTADAVLAARQVLDGFDGDILVLYGDTPLLSPRTLEKTVACLRNGADIAVLGFEARDPTGYGRLLTGDDNALFGIREDKDASSEEKKLTLCNSGVFAFRGPALLGILDKIGNDNAKGEYYLTDAVEIARQDGMTSVAVVCGEEEVLGVNTREQLAEAEAALQDELRKKAMQEGATLTAPETVFFARDTKLGRDVVIEPHVFFGPGVSVEDEVTIRAFSYLEETHIAKGATIGPFARLRPGTKIGAGARVGNFVEMKNATLEEGAKVNHLTYIGDALVGSGANVGAGTITCNYDGFAKHRTEIGAGAFIGSNSALVAPVKIGSGAYVGSGSVISRNVPDNALAVTRGPLDQRENWAQRMRKRRAKTQGNKT